MKRRHWREKHKDDPDRYGELWERVKLWPCFGLRFIEDHRCSHGHTAHHWRAVSLGGKDSDGLLPTCGKLHAALDGAPGWTLSDLLRLCGLTKEELHRVALEYVGAAQEGNYPPGGFMLVDNTDLAW